MQAQNIPHIRFS